jgi:hypothetical protein
MHIFYRNVKKHSIINLEAKILNHTVLIHYICNLTKASLETIQRYSKTNIIVNIVYLFSMGIKQTSISQEFHYNISETVHFETEMWSFLVLSNIFFFVY